MNNGQTYEMGYLALSDLSEQDVQGLQTTLAGIVEARGGQVVSHGDVHFIDLAYEMIKKVGSKNHRHDQAYFTWMKFSSTTEMVEAIKEEALKQSEILRMMVVKTVLDDSATNVFSVETEEEAPAEETTEKASSEETTEVNEEPEENKVVTSDDLTLIEGIGPVIAQTLTNAGISSFGNLADAEIDVINETITGVRGNHDASTWSQQAALARDGKFDELKTLQDELTGGRES